MTRVLPAKAHPILALQLFVALLFASAMAPAMATSALASDITGKVVDIDKRPIAGAVVVINHLDTGRTIVRKTNAAGRYHAVGLRADGLYQVTVISEHGTVQFKPGALILGHRMRRNAVVGYVPSDPPDFMRSWQWNQDDKLAFSLRTRQSWEG